ncbi:hypothetical protein N9A86_02405 [Akkermansiaceae bacterium]|nr:hypothetical protein [Akkermansiaceae bacterium]
MVSWDYLPDIRFGQGQTLRLGFEKVVDGMYLRLVYTDIATTNPDFADFDGDGYTNLEEVVVYKTSPFEYDEGGPTTGGGGGGNNPDVPLAQFELQVTTTEAGLDPQTVRLRLDAGFNAITDGGFYVDGGVPSVSISRSSDITTEVTLVDLTGKNQGATLNYLQLQEDKHPVPGNLDITRMIDAWPFTIPVDEGNGIPPPPFISFTFVGDLPPVEAGSTIAWLLKPMDISAVFGIAADFDSHGFFIQQLQNRLANENNDPLEHDEIFNKGNIWGVRGIALREEGEDPEEKVYAIEIYKEQDPLDRALQSKERILVFDGHSNFGLGPNFVKTPIKTIENFANYGVGYTDIPLTYYGIPGQMVQPNPDGSFPSNGPGDAGDQASDRVGLEGWAYLVPQANEIMGDVINYNPEPLPDLRFPNSGVPDEGTITQKGVAPNFFHYNGRLMVSAPGDELPDLLGYKTFFYHACSSGIDYIENFQNKEFIYTTQTCFITEASWVFVNQVMDGRDGEFITNFMNDQEGLGGDDEDIDYYGFHDFDN